MFASVALKPRCCNKSNALSSSTKASSRSNSNKRSRISCAALRVKVIANNSSGFVPVNNKRNMRDTNNQVLPLPAQASIKTECCGSQATAVKVAESTAAPFTKKSCA